MKSKIGLLIDVNSFPQFGKEEDKFNDENSPMMEDVFSISGCSSGELCPLDSRLEAKVQQLSEFTLEQLTKEATLRGEFIPSSCQFTYRYFNSSNYLHAVKELRSFVPFDATSFDIFEKSLETEVRNALANGEEICPEKNRMSLMSSALKGMISDFEWDPMVKNPAPLPRNSSSVSVKSYSSSCDSISPESCESNKNVMYVFFRVPRDEDEMQEFVDDIPDKLDIATSSKQFLNALIPKAFQDMITQRYQMRINFVDMWSLHDRNYEDETLSTIYPNSILKVLRYLHGGQILHPTPKMTMMPGLPSWKVFLKSALKAHSPQISSISSRGSESGSGTSHVSDSSRCSTPVQNGGTSNLQAIKNLVQGSGKKGESESKSSRDRIRLVKDALLNSQSQSLSGSQLSLPSFKPRANSSRHERFASKSKQMILMPKSNRPVILPLLRDSLDLLTYKSKESLLDVHSTSGGHSKKVRRNLFAVSSPEPNEEIKRLLASTARLNFSQSPSSSRSGSLPRSLFRSPRAAPSPVQPAQFKSPGSANVLKSRRHFGGGRSVSASMSPLSASIALGYGGSPVQVLSGLICPESPATPPTKRPRTSSFNSCEKIEIVRESPEAHHSRNLCKKSHFTRHDSFTFYSSSSAESLPAKSRAWEQSGRKLQAARIKDSVDMSQIHIAHSTLSLDDLELLDPTASPLTKYQNITDSPLTSK